MSPRSRNVLRWSAFTVAVLSTVLLVVAGTARSTVVDAGYYRAVLDEEQAYDRLYDEVLVDPEAAGVTRNLLGRLPVPEAVITSNVKTVLPPTAVRGMADDVIGDSVSYLRGERKDLRLSVDIKPVLANIGDLGNIYFGDLIASLQDKPSPDYPAFNAGLGKALDSIAEGRKPADLPSLPLSDSQAEAATDAVLKAVPAAQRAALRPRVAAALGSGDVATALAEVGPVFFTEERQLATRQLRGAADGSSWDVSADLDAGQDRLAPVRQARSFTKLGLGIVQTLAAVLGAAALAILWLTGPPSPARRMKRIGAALASGGALAATAIGLTRLLAGGSLLTPSRSWPDSLARLVDDLQHAALDRFIITALLAALIPLAAGLLLYGTGWAWQRRGAHDTLRGRARWIAPIAVMTTLAGAVLIPSAFAGQSERRCQGSAVLCERPYDQLAQLASHNSMSTTQNQFIGPLQDPDITGQLNDGVRALLIDTHHWEKPSEITERLKLSDFQPEMRREIVEVLDRAAPPRPGPWLCHAVCRAGSIPLVPELEKLGGWLADNPSEVVTLIVQDAISGEETAAAVREAGLDKFLFEPDSDPSAEWPTLGEMVDSDRRLVVFAEEADGPALWYRNFYRYGMETPFAFASPAEMTCAPNRGGRDHRLFLMNHFITHGGGSRLDAGEINAREAVLDRAHACERERGSPVNFIAVDYATIGNALGAVNALNAERGH